MKLLEILSKGGNGSREGKAELNYTLIKLLEIWKDTNRRINMEWLTAKLFSEEEIGEYPIVICRIEYVEGKEEGIIFGKIYLEEDERKAEIEMIFNITEKGTTFKATVVIPTKKQD